MANRYGEAALKAARGSSARTTRWDSAMEILYPTSPTALHGIERQQGQCRACCSIIN